METKTFTVVTSISMVITIAVAALSMIGVAITGFYPGIIVLFLLALIPIASKSYAKKSIRSDDSKRHYYTRLTILNLLAILIVSWMTFVILVDRVFSKVL